MKIEALKEYINNTIRQEVKKVIKEELQGYLSEVFSSKQKNVTNQLNLEEEVEPKVEPKIEQKPKKYIKYTSNELLNKVLNETSGGVPKEGSFVGLMNDGLESNVEALNEVKVPESAPEPVKTVVNAINRDYRSLMKAVDKKRSSKT